jgi:hypothetical protein
MATGSPRGPELDFGQRRQIGDPWFTATDEKIDGQHVDLYYDLNSLYIEGFRVGIKGFTLDKKQGPGFIISGGEVRDLGFGVSYAALGLKRDESLYLSPHDLQCSLVAFRHFDYSKNRNDAKFKMHVAKIIIGFAEAIRFRDIVDKICNSKMIDPANDLDWNRRMTAGDRNVGVHKIG